VALTWAVNGQPAGCLSQRWGGTAWRRLPSGPLSSSKGACFSMDRMPLTATRRQAVPVQASAMQPPPRASVAAPLDPLRHPVRGPVTLPVKAATHRGLGRTGCSTSGLALPDAAPKGS
jgi:hypothetical protein